MGLSFWRRTKDALLRPSVYFERISVYDETKDSFAYLLISTIINYALFALPLLVLVLFLGGSVGGVLSLITVIPISLLLVGLHTILLHLAVMITTGKKKRLSDSFKAIVFTTEPMKLLTNVGLLIASVPLVFYLKNSIANAALLVGSPLAALGFLQELYVLAAVFYVGYILIHAYLGFMILVAAHKLHRISLERSFWTLTVWAALAVVLGLLVVGAFYLVTASLAGPAVQSTIVA